MSMPLDPVGNISLVLQVVILFILILGVPLARGEGSKKNYVRHGYLTALALILHTVLVLTVMIFMAFDGFVTIADLPIVNLIAVLSHMILGAAALVLGFVVVGLWLSKPLEEMACFRARRAMLPLFTIWTISLVTGAIIHILELF